jgi:hypothetical protein
MNANGAQLGRDDQARPGVNRGAEIYDVIDRCLHDPRFRAALRDDPENTVRKIGLQLSGGEWAALRDLVRG